MKMILMKRGKVLMPFDDETLDRLDTLPQGSNWTVNLSPARNPQYHRYALKMLRIMHDMTDDEIPFEKFRRLLTIKAGYFTVVGKVRSVHGGEEISSAVVPDSLAFENMDEDQFRSCWNAMHQAFVDKFGLSLSPEELDQWSRM